MLKRFTRIYFTLSLTLVFLLLTTFYLLRVTNVLAQIPDPYVPANETDDEEFHSLRPYQASPAKIPLQENEQVIQCGNDLIVNDEIRIPQDEHEIIRCVPDCKSVCPGQTRCYIKAPRKWIIGFDAFASELPIAGNTELTPAGNPINLGLLTGAIVDYLRLTYWNSSTLIIRPPSIIPPLPPLPELVEHLPPDPNKYKNYQTYYEDYLKWRGGNCLSVTIPFSTKKILLCFDDPTNPNFWSTMFVNVPYTSTEDRLGKARVYEMIWYPKESNGIDKIDPDPPNTTFTPYEPPYGNDPNILPNTDPNIPQPSNYGETPLYFPHMEEGVEAISLLQSTYLPPEIMEEEQSIGEVTPTPPPNDECKIVGTRYNPGDQLFGAKKDDLGVPNAEVSYTAYFWCEAECVKDCPWCDCHPKPRCVKNAVFHSNVETYTPMIDELFSKTVSGNASVVKKIFPQIGEETPIDEVKDIPAKTAVTHQSIGDNRNAHVEPVVSMPADFYIPHLGSVYDYFLQDIQTALRPKGYGAQSAALTKNAAIPEVDRLNEYVSWYLNGTIYRAENDPLDPEDEKDTFKVVNFSGPLNKLLSQQSQWRNIFKFNSISYDLDEANQGRADTVNKAVESKSGNPIRHDQIAACIIGKVIHLPFFDITIGGFPTACKMAFMDNLPASREGEGEPPGETPGTSPPPGTQPQLICDIASQYNVPCCFLEGIWDTETGQSQTGPTGDYGNLHCCNSAGFCGPMQIGGGLLGPLSAGEKLDICSLPDAWILAARLLVLKKCVAEGSCNNWNWQPGLEDQFPVSPNELEIAGMYHGVNNCTPSNETQCRWGEGKSYCDAIESWCKNGTRIPDNCTQEYCDALGTGIKCF